MADQKEIREAMREVEHKGLTQNHLKKDQIKIRLESQEMALKALIDSLIKAGVINEQQLHDNIVSRGLHWRNKALRDVLKQLNTNEHRYPR